MGRIEMAFAPLVDNRKLQAVFKKPQQDLMRGTEFDELREDELHGLLNAAIRILLQSLIRGFDVASRSSHNEFAAAI